MAATPALKQLAALGVAVTLHPYAYDPAAAHIGLAAASALGLDPAVTLKCLMVEVDGRPACCVIPAGAQLSMKRVAAAFGGKAAAMMPPAKAERLTGYHVGGISPFGQKKRVPVAFEEAALAHATVYMNGGQRGLQVHLKPADAVKALEAKAVPLVAD